MRAGGAIRGFRVGRVQAAALAAALLACGCAAPTTQHGAAGALSFTVPAGWTLTPVGHLKHYNTVLAYLTSPGASASESCGRDYNPGMGSGCTATYTTPADSIVIRLEEWQLPARSVDAAVAEIAAEVADGARSTTVAGQPAAYHATYQDVDAPQGGTTAAWWVAGPATQDPRNFAIVVWASDGDAATDPAVKAIVDSLQIAASDPPAP